MGYTPLPLIVRPNARTSRLQGNYRITKTRLSFLGRLGVINRQNNASEKLWIPVVLVLLSLEVHSQTGLNYTSLDRVVSMRCGK